MGKLEVYRRGFSERLLSILFGAFCAVAAFILALTIIGIFFVPPLLAVTYDSVRKLFGYEYSTCADCLSRTTFRRGDEILTCKGCGQIL